MTASLSDLLYQLYGCSRDAARWPDVLESLTRTLGVQTAVLQWCRLESGRLQPMHSVTNLGAADRHRRYQADISDACNPRLDAQRLQDNIGRVVQDGDVIANEGCAMRFRDALASIGLGRFLGGACALDNGHYLTLALHQSVGGVPDFTSEQHQTVTQLLQHLQQVAQMTDAAASTHRLQHEMASMVDQLRCGVVLCDTRGRLDWSNRTAQRLLASGPLQVADGVLRCTARDEATALSQALARASTTYLLVGGGLQRQRIQACVQALPQEPGSAGNGRRLVMLADEADGGYDLPAEAIASLFRLTPAEARLTAALCSGTPLDRYAEQRGISIGTVRGQAKQVLAKTHTARQSDLVRLVMSSVVTQSAARHLH